ncbi:MAG: hypothetical protein [Caudoviricetes sp.]|nr:MAG: hypothetical protein [Caudoviricetes sp.]
MKLKTAETPIMSGGDLQMKGFQIAASAKAFRILSSNLYKNKIRAIIRELSCNAVDGHIAGNSIAPFDVQLPSMLDPQFRIRDYGCGMDDDTIMNLYTTYFASTKSDSNDYIGALGLGSKSPFSYTDSFTVVAFFDGVRRVYSAFIKDGEPTITKVSEQETTEHNGIEITVPVNPDDINRWRNEASYVYAPFGKIRPNFIGWKPTSVDLTSSEDSFFADNVADGSVYAIMGNIVYPIPIEYWNNSMISLNMRGGYNYGSPRKSFYIRFELGELDITPSREELSLDDETIKNIQSRIDKTNSEMAKDLVALCKTFTNVRKLKKEIVAKYSRAHWEHVVRSSYVTKTGKTVSSVVDSLVWKHPTETKSKASTVAGMPAVQYKENIDFYRYDVSMSKPRGKKVDEWSMNNVVGIDSSGIHIFINDMKSGHIRTMVGLEKLKVFSGYVYVIPVEHEQVFMQKFNELFEPDEMTIRYSSKCDDARKANPTTSTSTRSAYRTPNAKVLTTTGETAKALYAADIKELKGYWIAQHNSEIVSSQNEHYGINFDTNAIQIFMKAHGITEIPIIKKSHWDYALKNKDLKEPWEDIAKYALSLKDKIDESIFPFDNRGETVISAFRRNAKLKHIADKFERINQLNDTYTVVKSIKNSLGNFKTRLAVDFMKTNEKEFEFMLTKFGEVATIINTKSEEALKRFREENQLIYFYIQRSYGSISDSVADEIIRTVKL